MEKIYAKGTMAMGKFVDRFTEMETLEKEYNRAGASFVVVYGRRRVGKTALINKFCDGKERAIRFLATEEQENANLMSFKEKIAEELSNPLLSAATVTRWEPVFDVIAENCPDDGGKLILVIDEFQYLGKANSAFPSILMNIWDEKLKDKNFMLILCGSLIHMMTAQVLSYASPLYGRNTAQMKMKQIPFKYYSEFYPNLTEDERILRYAVTGGVPKYIELFEEKGDIFSAIRTNILSGNSFLYAEPEFLLQKEVSEIGSYFSLLKTIAAGNHKLSKIATAMGVAQTGLSKYLSTLAELDIIERQVPITEENPAKSKKGLYFIKDNFIKFWFQFVYPYKDLLEAEQTDFVMQKIKANFIDNHAAYVYEDICREKIWQYNEEAFSFTKVGRWWGEKDVEIDIVAYDALGNDIIFGECKYSVNPKGMDVLRSLMSKKDKVSWKKEDRKEHFIIFSRSGYTEELKEYADKAGNVVLG
jgi:hypothetical protein